MAGEGTPVTTGVGRIVWGNPGKATIKKDPQTNQPVIRDGKQVEQWAFGLAIPKADFLATLWPVFSAEAAKGYPSGIPQAFSWKFKDGDTSDRQGVPYSNREGYAGHYVITISTEAFAPPIWRLVNGVYQQWPGDQIKTGDYIACGLLIKVNVPENRTHTPGLYVNPTGIEFVGYGTEIRNGPDAQQIFGGRQHQLPAGASATPIATPGAAMPGVPGAMPAPAGMPAPGGYPAPAAPQPAPYAPPAAPPGYPVPTPGVMPPPAPDFIPGAAPAPGGYPAPAAPQPGYPASTPGMPGGMPPR